MYVYIYMYVSVCMCVCERESVVICTMSCLIQRCKIYTEWFIHDIKIFGVTASLGSPNNLLLMGHGNNLCSPIYTLCKLWACCDVPTFRNTFMHGLYSMSLTPKCAVDTSSSTCTASLSSVTNACVLLTRRAARVQLPCPLSLMPACC